MASKEALEAVAEEAEVLMQAADILDTLVDAEDEMLEDGELPEDETSDQLREDIADARDTCNKVSMAMTIALAQSGYVPDFSDDEDDEREGNTAFY